jgi:hypothetical protein
MKLSDAAMFAVWQFLYILENIIAGIFYLERFVG